MRSATRAGGEIGLPREGLRHNRPMPLGEFDLIERYFTRPVQRAVLGVGDDCALLAPRPGQQLAVSSDLLVEGRHFLSTVPPAALGHKALAVNLSDLAACGACAAGLHVDAGAAARPTKCFFKDSPRACSRSPMRTASNSSAATRPPAH